MKIYNEVISRFNEKTNKWETISEDSFDYNGRLDLMATECTAGAAAEWECCRANLYLELKDADNNDLNLSYAGFLNECNPEIESSILVYVDANQSTQASGIQTCCMPNNVKKISHSPDSQWGGDAFYLCTGTPGSDPGKCYMENGEPWVLDEIDLGSNWWNKNSRTNKWLCDLAATNNSIVRGCTGFDQFQNPADDPSKDFNVSLECDCPNDGCDSFGDCELDLYTPCSTTPDYDYYCDTEIGALGQTELDNLPYCGQINECGVCTPNAESNLNPGQCCNGAQEDPYCGLCIGITQETIFGGYQRLNFGDGQGAIYCDCNQTLPVATDCYLTNNLDDTAFSFDLCSGEVCPPGYSNNPEAAADPGCVDPQACNYSVQYDLDCNSQSADTFGIGWNSCCVYPTSYCSADGSAYTDDSPFQDQASQNGLCDVDQNGNPSYVVVACPSCYDNVDNPPQCMSFGYDAYPYSSHLVQSGIEMINAGQVLNGELMYAGYGTDGEQPSPGIWNSDTSTFPIEWTDLCPEGETNCGPFGNIPSPGFTIGDGCTDPVAYNYGVGSQPLYDDPNFNPFNENPITTCQYCPPAGSPEAAATGCEAGYTQYWQAYLTSVGVGDIANALNFVTVGPNETTTENFVGLPPTIFHLIGESDVLGFPSISGRDLAVCICNDDLSVLEDLRTIQEGTTADSAITLFNIAAGGDNYGQFRFNYRGKLETLSSGGHNCILANESVEDCRLKGLQLAGQLPSSIGTLSDLTYLDLSANSLTGYIPRSIGNLPLLQELHLHDNFLTELNNDYSDGERGHGILPATSEYYGICRLMDPSFGNLDFPQNDNPWLTLYNNSICPNVESNLANTFSYPECLAPDVGSEMWANLDLTEYQQWQNWIYNNLGFADLPSYQDYNISAQNIQNEDGTLNCPVEGCMDVSAKNYWPQADTPCANCCQYDNYYHFPWGTDISFTEDSPGSPGGDMELYEMVQALHANQYGFKYNSAGDLDVTSYPIQGDNIDDECFIFENYLTLYQINQCPYEFYNNPNTGGFPEPNSIINYWDGIWIRNLGGGGSKVVGQDPNGNNVFATGDARPLEFINRVLYEASTKDDPAYFANYWFSFFPQGGLDISFDGIEYFEDFDLNGNGTLDATDVSMWRTMGRDDIADMIETDFEGMQPPEPAPENVEMWEQAPVSVNMAYSKQFISETQVLFGKQYKDLSDAEKLSAAYQLTGNGQFQCSDGGPSDSCYTAQFPCGLVSELVEDCTPCGNVEYDDEGEVIDGTGGDCIPITLDTAAEGHDKISKTKTLEFNYFGESTPNLKGNSIFTASLSSSNHPYYFNVLDNNPNTLGANNVFSVSWGHYAGSGSYTAHNTKVGSSEAVYKQYSSLLLDDDSTEKGFLISSGSDVTSDGNEGNIDKWIYVLNFKRNKYEDNLQAGTWTLTLSGSHSGGKTIKLTDNSLVANNNQNFSIGYRGDMGRRFDIVSGSNGTPHTGYQVQGGRYGWYYPDAGIMVLGEKISHEMSGSSAIGVGKFNSVANGSDQLYPQLISGSDSKNALRLINTLKKVNGDAVTLYGEKEVTEVIYVCRLAGEEFNFTNNFTILSGSGRTMYTTDTGVMNGFNTRATSSAFTESNAKSSIIFGSSTETVSQTESGETFIWPGSNVTTMHGDPHTFITGIQLYDEHGEMLAVATLSKPLKKAFDREAVIKVKLTY